MPKFSPLPIEDPVVEPSLLGSVPWLEWLSEVSRVLDRSPQRAQQKVYTGTVSLEDQAASVASTTIASPLAAGLYRVSYYARITQAATSSSTLDVTIGWGDDDQTQTFAGATINGNTVTTYQNDSFLIHVTGGGGITYQLDYTSTGATVMQYRFDIYVEEMP